MAEKCPARVSSGDYWSGHVRTCGRKVKAHGFCGIHDPEKKKARAAERDAKWEAHMEGVRLRDAAGQLADALEDALRLLDPKTVADAMVPKRAAVKKAHAALKAAGRRE